MRASFFALAAAPPPLVISQPRNVIVSPVSGSVSGSRAPLVVSQPRNVWCPRFQARGTAMSVGGKCAVVTGSNSGIGLGVAEELARLGADVVLNSFTDRPEDHALARSSPTSIRSASSTSRPTCPTATTAAALVATRRRAARPRRHPGQQRRHPARRPDPGLPRRQVGPDPRDQPLLGLPHHRRRPAADARPGLGPHRQHRLRPRPHRLAVQVGLRRRQARRRRPHQGRRPRDRRGADHLQRHLPRLRADPARRGADPRHHEAVRHGPRAR